MFKEMGEEKEFEKPRRFRRLAAFKLKPNLFSLNSKEDFAPRKVLVRLAPPKVNNSEDFITIQFSPRKVLAQLAPPKVNNSEDFISNQFAPPKVNNSEDFISNQFAPPKVNNSGDDFNFDFDN